MAVHFSLRRVANTVLVVVGAFMIGGVFHRALVTGEAELFAQGSIVRILLGVAILAVAYQVRVPRGEWEYDRDGEEPEDGGGETVGAEGGDP